MATARISCIRHALEVMPFQSHTGQPLGGAGLRFNSIQPVSNYGGF